MHYFLWSAGIWKHMIWNVKHSFAIENDIFVLNILSATYHAETPTMKWNNKTRKIRKKVERYASVFVARKIDYFSRLVFEMNSFALSTSKFTLQYIFFYILLRAFPFRVLNWRSRGCLSEPLPAPPLGIQGNGKFTVISRPVFLMPCLCSVRSKRTPVSGKVQERCQSRSRENQLKNQTINNIANSIYHTHWKILLYRYLYNTHIKKIILRTYSIENYVYINCIEE